MSSSKNILKNVLKLSFSIFINKPIGLLRDILKVRYFGVSSIGDAFSIAWRIPNTFRRLFTEGAISSILTPYMIMIKEKYGDKELNSFNTALFFIMQIIVAIVCLFISIYSFKIIKLIAPGALERLEPASKMLKILIFFTLFMSGSAIFTSSLQIINYFSLGPISQFILNIALSLEFFICYKYDLSYTILSIMLLLNGFIILGISIFEYKRHDFYFSLPTKNTKKLIINFFIKVFPAFFSSCIMEINPIIDLAIASYLPVGSQSMYDYVSAFIRIPIQIFGSAFATVITPKLSKIAITNKKRINFYLLEAFKLMFFLSMPCIFFILFFSNKFFNTFLVSSNFSIENAIMAAKLLSAFSFAIFFSMINKILCNIFYINQNSIIPTTITLLTAMTGTFINYLIVNKLGLFGLVFSFIFIEILRSIFYLYYLNKNFNIFIPIKKFILFCNKFLFFLFKIILKFIIIYFSLYFIFYLLDLKILLNTILYWLWVSPIALYFSYLLLFKRKENNINLFYLKI